jgi:mannose-1-phosphate guanylyltransferase
MVNLILCGGAGTRLWPLSRKKTPKQFARIFRDKSLFEEALSRNRPLCDKFLVATNIQHLPLVEKQMARMGIEKVEGLLEPSGRNTAPAIALILMGLPQDELVLVSPSDHRITKQDQYVKAVHRAAELASQGFLVTFGIRPQYAETGYGYIEADGENVISFREKPDRQTAENYLASGHYFWNSGMFVFSAGTFLDELSSYAPEVFAAVARTYERAEKGDLLRPRQEDMMAIPSISIDYAVMEKSKRVRVVVCDPGWSDLGSFDALYDEALGDADNAVLADDVTFLNSRRCLVVGGEKPIILEGVEDLIVVQTDDTTLIMRRGQSQNVRDVLKAVAERRPDLL